MDQAVDVFLRLLAEKGWRATHLADVAAGAGLTLAELHALYPSKAALVAAFTRRVDDAVFKAPVDADGTVRDRLFDLLMRRFDALMPHKDALKALLRAGPDCGLAFTAGPRLTQSLRWTLDAAGLDTGGFLGLLRIKGLAAAYAWAMRAFLTDDSADKAKTMAALDQALARAESVAKSLPGFARA